MIKAIIFTLIILTVIVSSICGATQASFRDDPTVVTESGYTITSSSTGYKVNVALILSNPYKDRFAANPSVQITLRSTDGAIIATRTARAAGIPPAQTIAHCLNVYVDESPKTMEFKPLSAHFESTDLKASEIRPFVLQNLHSRNASGRTIVTGEIKNPYPTTAGAWVVFLFRDKSGKLLGGQEQWISEIPSMESFPFETTFIDENVPHDSEIVDRLVFSHNNSQSTWHKMLER